MKHSTYCLLGVRVYAAFLSSYLVFMCGQSGAVPHRIQIAYIDINGSSVHTVLLYVCVCSTLLFQSVPRGLAIPPQHRCFQERLLSSVIVAEVHLPFFFIKWWRLSVLFLFFSQPLSLSQYLDWAHFSVCRLT